MGSAKKDPIVVHHQEIATLCKGKKENELGFTNVESNKDKDDLSDLRDMNSIMEAIYIDFDFELENQLM
eukprot:13869961-Ditylum_brightwellii.AAC.1